MIFLKLRGKKFKFFQYMSYRCISLNYRTEKNMQFTKFTSCNYPFSFERKFNFEKRLIFFSLDYFSWEGGCTSPHPLKLKLVINMNIFFLNVFKVKRQISVFDIFHLLFPRKEAT